MAFSSHSSLFPAHLSKRLALTLGCTVIFLSAATAQVEDAPMQRPKARPVIVVGFVGGFVRSDDHRHSEVQLIDRLGKDTVAGVYTGIFENRQREQAQRAILRWLDTDGDGTLSEEEKARAHIILFGHSWGGSAVITLARELGRRDIPVLLTIQVDSIARHGEKDCIIPANVAESLNFYQTRGILHGCPGVRAIDPAETNILGNYRFDYRRLPSECRKYPWHDRWFFMQHTAIECDPRVWTRIEEEIRMRLPDAATQQLTRIGAEAKRDP